MLIVLLGYNVGIKVILKICENLGIVLYCVSILGCIVIGGLIVIYV